MSDDNKPAEETADEKTNDNVESSTTVEEVEFENIDEVLGIPSASVVMTPDKDEKNSVLDNGKIDIDFLDEIPKDEPIEDEETQTKVVEALVDAPLQDEDLEEAPKNKGGRPSLSKDAMVEAATRLVEKGIIQPFDDDKKLEQYTVDDFEELIQANIDQKLQATAESAPVELFKQLPEEVQAVVHYALNGGNDTKSVFKQLSKAQETFDLDVTKEEDQEIIARQYLNLTAFGTAEEIEDEINVIKDRGDLEKYSTRYKPKLDAKQAEVIEQRLAQQEQAKMRKQEAQKHYQNNVYNALNKKDLNGIPLNNKIQTMLFYGLTDSSKYQDSKGNNTNALGYLLEQHQFGKNANPSLVAEALWLLADPVDYRSAVKRIGQNEEVIETTRKLRTSEASKITSSTGIGEKQASAKRTKPKPTVQRGGRNLFSRK